MAHRRLHSTEHQHGGGDEIATATPAANAIPKADASSKLDTWISNASDTVQGKIELATQAEVDAGTDAVRAVTPATLAAKPAPAPSVRIETASDTPTTTSATDTLVTGMSITPGAGTYLCRFTSTVGNSKNANGVWISIYVNGVKNAASERSMLGQANNQGGIACECYATVAAGQAIDVRWRVSAASTGTIYQRTFIVMPAVSV